MIHTLAGHRDEFLDEEFRKWFGLAIFDECHHVAAPTFKDAADLVAGIRLALTATATRTDGMQAIYQYHLGRVFYQALEQELIPDTVFHEVPWRVPEDELHLVRNKRGITSPGKLCTWLGQQDRRNDLIMEILRADMQQGRECMVLSHSVDHVTELGRRCATLYPDTGIIAGYVDQAIRVPILNQSNPIVAIFGLSREGLNKKPLSSLILTTPVGNYNDLQQSFGRVQRVHPDKPDPVVHVVEDRNIKTCKSSCDALRRFLKVLDYPYRSQQLCVSRGR